MLIVIWKQLPAKNIKGGIFQQTACNERKKSSAIQCNLIDLFFKRTWCFMKRPAKLHSCLSTRTSLTVTVFLCWVTRCSDLTSFRCKHFFIMKVSLLIEVKIYQKRCSLHVCPKQRKRNRLNIHRFCGLKRKESRLESGRMFREGRHFDILSQWKSCIREDFAWRNPVFRMLVDV